MRETYNISLSSSAGEQAVTLASNGAQFFDKPLDNVGMKSIPDFEFYARQHVCDITVPGCANIDRAQGQGSEESPRRDWRRHCGLPEPSPTW